MCEIRPYATWEQFRQHLLGTSHRPTPVADLVLLLGRKLGHVAAGLGDKDDGVIAETVFATHLVGDQSLARAVAVEDLALGRTDSDCAAEATRSPFLRHVRHHLQDPLHLVFERSLRAEEPPGMETRRSAQRVDDESAIVGEAELARCHCSGASLQLGILGERHAGLFDIGIDVWKIREREDLKAGIGQDGSDLTALARVARSDDYPTWTHSRSSSCCRSWRRGSPWQRGRMMRGI